MYYEEKMINGILCFRGTPDGDWIPLTVEMIQQKKIRHLEQQVAELTANTPTLIGVDWDKETHDKAKAWDDLEALVIECKDTNKSEFIEIDNEELGVLSTNWNGCDYVFEGKFSKEAVSKALLSIREGE